MCQELLSLFKTDVNAAFRRVPIKELDRKYGHVVFVYEARVMPFAQALRNCAPDVVCQGVTYISVHYRLPFGSIASVHGWDRVGETILACTCGLECKFALARSR